MMRVSTAYNVFQIATGEEELTARRLGTEVLLSKLPVKFVKTLYQRACKRQKNSFIEGTLVYAENELVPIESLKIGDKVLSFNESTGDYEYKDVIHLVTGYKAYNLYSIVFGGEELIATAEHPFYVNGSWLDANQLIEGLPLTSIVDTYSVDEVILNVSQAKVYNITVADNHNYFVSSKKVLTHNTDLCDFVTSKVDPNKVVNALTSYKGRTWQIGGHKFRLTKGTMKHILERHHPKFFDIRNAKAKNTPLPSSWSLQDVETAVLIVINQNRSKLIKAGSGSRGAQFEGVYQGMRFRLGIKNGKIGQFTPLD
jgi:hypothetical protein